LGTSATPNVLTPVTLPPGRWTLDMASATANHKQSE
jgi:hypothetical protein